MSWLGKNIKYLYVFSTKYSRKTCIALHDWLFGSMHYAHYFYVFSWYVKCVASNWIILINY